MLKFILTIKYFTYIIKIITVILDFRCGIMKVYEKISQFLESNKVDIQELAVKAEIPSEDLISMLSGKKVLYADEFRSICIALNVKPEIFI